MANQGARDSCNPLPVSSEMYKGITPTATYLQASLWL